MLIIGKHPLLVRKLLISIIEPKLNEYSSHKIEYNWIELNWSQPHVVVSWQARYYFDEYLHIVGGENAIEKARVTTVEHSVDIFIWFHYQRSNFREIRTLYALDRLTLWIWLPIIGKKKFHNLTLLSNSDNVFNSFHFVQC